MLELRDIKFSVTDDIGQTKNIINGVNLHIDESKLWQLPVPTAVVNPPLQN